MRIARLPRSAHFASTILVMSVFFSLSLAPMAVEAETIYKYTNSKGEVVFTDQPTKGAQKLNIDPPPVIPLTPINLPPSTPPATEPSKPAANAESPKPSEPLVPSVQMQPQGTAPAVDTPVGKPDVSSTSQQGRITAAPAENTSNAPKIVRQSLPETVSSTPAIPPQNRNGHYQSLIITEPKAGAVTAHAGGTIFVQTKLSPELDQSVGDRMRIVIDGNTRVDDSTGQRFMISDLTPGTHAIIAIIMRKGKNIFQSNPVVIDLKQGMDDSAQK
ncbi:DUF4124 domain-containing protein [Halothiobacillus sp. 15-55-196]|uniref:DUF4124 domain-containing protein n=1 Tax=Halothiobacillus sp. 15-55-196 TaxID=1970382 RepID=UPI0025B92312|nr:DUF4124 domain-containing protein [Halothiobacillus sp. 15-55-196]